MREFLRKAVTESMDASAINLVKDWCKLSSLPSVLKLTRLGVVEVERKISSTTTATDSKDLFRISSLRFIFTNGLAVKSLLSIMPIGIAQIKVYPLWKKPKLL